MYLQYFKTDLCIQECDVIWGPKHTSIKLVSESTIFNIGLKITAWMGGWVQLMVKLSYSLFKNDYFQLQDIYY